ncbi:hypothetical protein WN944_009728 [Citrus x changshan-huyou]|uniref:rRNA biogenesis protein RRP36 n=2 Tax=Citrus TaxID=2706 RepID=A0AAP0MWP6_9ROSI
MRELNDAIVSSRKIKFEEFKEEDHKTTSVSSSEEKDEIERELAEIRFEDLQKARSDGLNLVYRKINQANKNRPMANGAKQLVIRFRKVVQAPKRKQSTYWLDTIVNCNRKNCLNEMLLPWWFRKRYYFLFENNLPAGKEELKKQLKKSIDANAIENMKKWISWIVSAYRTFVVDLCLNQQRVLMLLYWLSKRRKRAEAKHGG